MRKSFACSTFFLNSFPFVVCCCLFPSFFALFPSFFFFVFVFFSHTCFFERVGNEIAQLLRALEALKSSVFCACGLKNARQIQFAPKHWSTRIKSKKYKINDRKNRPEKKIKLFFWAIFFFFSFILFLRSTSHTLSAFVH